MTEKTFKFYCDQCHYGTDLKVSYDQHLKTTLHLTGKRKERCDKVTYKCDHCVFESRNKNNYLTHVLNNHSTTEERERDYKYYCKKCDFGVFTKTLYDHHLMTKKHQIKTIS